MQNSYVMIDPPDPNGRIRYNGTVLTDAGRDAFRQAAVYAKGQTDAGNVMSRDRNFYLSPAESTAKRLMETGYKATVGDSLFDVRHLRFVGEDR